MQEIKGIARVKFLPGKLEEWKRLTEQAMRRNLTGDQPKLFTPWLAMQDEPAASD